MDIKKYFKELASEAFRSFQRRMIVLSGEREEQYRILMSLRGQILSYEERVAFETPDNFTLAPRDTFKEVERHLGRTYDLIIADFHRSLVPNDLGILVSTVRGGGLFIAIVPPLDKWVEMRNFFHSYILTPPYRLEDTKTNFVRRVINKMREHEGIAIFENGELVKDGRTGARPYRRPRPRIPEARLFPREVYEIAVTQDQVRVLKQMEKIADGGVFIVTSDRGRGKSSALGLGAAGMALASGRRLRVLLTAPRAANVAEVFRFAGEALRAAGKRFDVEVYKGDVTALRSRKLVMEYWPPFKAVGKKADLLLVDEAAAIPVPILFRLRSSAPRVVYSTTVHGYEGTGRSFTIRFMRTLKEKEGKLRHIEMSDPIRYAPGDPIERWIFDTLLLDAEPPKLENVDLERLKYRRFSIEELLEREDLLREYYGIFVLAHYRNNPNDLGILCDAPNQEIRALLQDDHVVCSVQLAREGGLDEDTCRELYYGMYPAGNIIPDMVIKHYRQEGFGALRGLRIVRIATHPDFMDRGIGSLMLKNILKEEADWVGASFGATPRLLNFWLKNGFIPVHVSPSVNEQTGEFSVIVLRPLSNRAKKIVHLVRQEFFRRFVYSLPDVYREMEAELALQLLQAAVLHKAQPQLTDVQWKRLIAYTYGPATFEAVRDAVFELVKTYFESVKRPRMNKLQKLILVGKALQGKSWEELAKELGKGETFIMVELRDAVRKILDWRIQQMGRDDLLREVQEFKAREYRPT
ncbi:MAG TPA: tRNA(Met) cytidine acetyltransferase [Aciduliprofundum sp.]|nr:tRNA(Met) cytidine acetyltransferase [Aciduliprofundum sp.]